MPLQFVSLPSVIPQRNAMPATKNICFDVYMCNVTAGILFAMEKKASDAKSQWR